MEQEVKKEQSKPSWQQKPGYQPVPSLAGTEQHASHDHKVYRSDYEAKHHESVQKYPQLRLSNDEYVIIEVRRHPIGLFSIWGVVGLILVAVFALLPLYSVNMPAIANTFLLEPSSLPSPAILAFPMLVLATLFVIGGLVATYVYQNNRFYLTNESVIQIIQLSLFSKKEQHINLANIEDASYRQQGLIQHLFGYGSLRLSTEGDETTYRFHFVTNPQHVVHEVIEAMENATGNAARFRSSEQEPIPIGKH